MNIIEAKEILELQELTDEEIKKKYRELAKKYHPDINPEGHDRFLKIQEAYKYLKENVEVYEILTHKTIFTFEKV